MRDASRGIMWTAWLDELPQQCVEDAAKLLSSHWNRSTASRIASLRWGGREGREARERKIGTNGLETVLPRSLVLCMPGGCGAVVEEEQVRPRIVGHARLKRCSFELGATSVLVESVLIQASERGSGLGRLLMTSVESHARELGCTRIILSTSDQQGFYQTIGYCLMAAPTANLRNILQKSISCTSESQGNDGAGGQGQARLEDVEGEAFLKGEKKEESSESRGSPHDAHKWLNTRQDPPEPSADSTARSGDSGGGRGGGGTLSGGRGELEEQGEAEYREKPVVWAQTPSPRLATSTPPCVVPTPPLPPPTSVNKSRRS